VRAERDEHAARVTELSAELERATRERDAHATRADELRDELHALRGHANGQATEEMPVVDGNGSLPAPRVPAAVGAPTRTHEAAVAVRHEIPLTLAGHRHRVSAQPRRRPVRLRSESRWLPAEWVFGLLLLLVAAGVAALVLTGTVHVGHLH
jgi:hypothetical protein